MNITSIIKENNLYPQNDIQTYVQPFNDGTQFFWNKVPAFTQFINDPNGRFQQFFRNIRQNKQLSKNSIYFQHEEYTNDINKIRKSNFFNRISNTYLFSRTYDRMIASTDSDKTFYFCFVQPSQQILNDFIGIKGKFLFMYKKQNDINIPNNINILQIQDYTLLYNFNPIKTYDLFNL